VLATPDAVADAVWLQNMGVTALIFCTRARVPSVAPHMDVTQVCSRGLFQYAQHPALITRCTETSLV